MTTSINFNQYPYYDDFNSSKQFYRILFNPGMPVQARELTQIQSMLQAQIEQFGKHVFTNGSLVIPGESTYFNIAYAKVSSYIIKDPNYSSTTYLSLDELKNTIDYNFNTTTYIKVCGKESGCIGEIIEVLSEETHDIEKTIYYRPVTGVLDILVSGVVSPTDSTVIFISSSDKDTLIKGGVVYIKFNNVPVNRTIIDSQYDTTQNEYYIVINEALPFNTSNLVINNNHVDFKFKLSSQFVPGEELLLVNDLNTFFNNVTQKIITLKKDDTTIGFGLKVRINSGIFYANGFFLSVPELECFVDYYNTKISKSVGLKIVELVVDSNEDFSLNDPANNLINYNAPGADRLSIKTDLIAIDISTAENIINNTNSNYISYIEILRFNEGELERQIDKTIYSELAKEFAHRTYDESGNYWIKPFITKAKDHIDINKITLEIHPGKAYVYGYEVETILTKKMVVDKPKQSLRLSNDSMHFKFNNLLYADIRKGVPTLHKEYGLYVKEEDGNIIDEFVTDFSSEEFNTLIGFEGESFTRLKIGTCRIYTVVKYMAYHLIGLYDIKLKPGFTINSSVALVSLDAITTFEAVAVVSNEFGFYRDDIAPKFLITVPNTQVKTFYPYSTDCRMEYNVLRTLRQKLIINNKISNVINANEQFESMYSCLIVDATTGVKIPFFSVDIDGNSLRITSSINLDYKLVDINFVVHKVGVKERPKTLSVVISENVLLTNGKGFLENLDIFKIISIDDDSTTEFLNNFLLHNGQFDWYYTNGYVSTKHPSYSIGDRSVKITYSYFSHGSGDYFSVDSYIRPGNIVNKITYDEIPQYTNNDGLSVNLCNCLDFRIDIKQGQTVFADSDFILEKGYFQYDIELYLARIDKLWVNSKGKFGISTGIPALKPIEPLGLDGTMAIYLIEWPKYTYTKKDIKLKIIDNRNYTMRDIAKLDQRLSELEKYTTLSLLEKNSLDLQILDSNGLNRFKSGLVVDNFTTTNTILLETIRNDSVITESLVSIDTKNRVLRPAYHKKILQLKPHVSSSSSNINDNLLSLSYTTSLLITQPYASKTVNVNTYLSFITKGEVKLYPSSDFWRDSKEIDQVLTNNSDLTNALLSFANLGIIDTMWNDWQLEWSGVNSLKSIASEIDGNLFSANTQIISGDNLNLSSDLIPTNSSQAANYNINNQNIVENGTINNTYNSKTTFDGSKQVNINNELYVRNIPIQLKVAGMRPHTKLYVCFDSVNVTTYCSYTDKTILLKDIASDALGCLDVIFNVPKNIFLVGEILIEIKDSITSEFPLTCYACSLFYAKGIRTNLQEELAITRLPNISPNTVQTEKVISESTDENMVLNQLSYEPIAQSFTIPNSLINGCFIAKIDLFFKSKSETQPIIVEIRQIVNAVPGNRILSSILKSANDVVISSTGILETTFIFDSPLYLKPGTEYCFVVITDNPQYSVWVSKINEIDVNSQSSISSQPSDGFMFKSQMSKSWVIDRECDIKYNIHCCRFNNSRESFYFSANNNDLIKPLLNNCFELTNNTNTIIVFCANHGLLLGDMFLLIRTDYDQSSMSSTYVTMNDYCFSIFENYINFIVPNTLDDFYNLKVSKVISSDVFCFEFAKQYTVNLMTKTRFGGKEWKISTNARINVLGTFFDEMIHNNTTISYNFNATTKTRMGSLFKSEITNRENLVLTQPVWFLNDETTKNIYNNDGMSSWYEVTLTSNDVYVSPIIDLERSYCIAASNRINDSSLINHLLILDTSYQTAIESVGIFAHNSSDDLSESRYITKEIKLVAPALGLKIMFSANKPSGTNIEVYYRLFSAMETLENRYDKEWYKAFNKEYINIDYVKKTSTDTMYDINIPNPNTSNENYIDMYYESLAFDGDLDILINKTIEPDELYKFTSFQIKLLLKSENSSIIPSIKNFRVIAVI